MSPHLQNPEQIVVRTLLRSSRPSHHKRRIAKDLVWSWVARRWPRLMPDRSQQEAAELQRAAPGRSLRVVSSEDGATWALEVCASERDGTAWTTTALVADTGEADMLALETRFQGTSETRVVAPPKLLASWVQRLPLDDDGIAVSGEARSVEEAQDVETLCRQLLQPGRRLPFVVLANKPGTRYYGIDPRGIAESLQGLAHVACLAPTAVAALTERFGRRLAPAPAAVRVYLPGFDAEDASNAHPVIRPRKPAAEADPAVNEATAFRRYVCRRVCELGAVTPALLPAMGLPVGR